MIRQEEVFKIGKIGRPHGVKGEVSLLFDDDVFDRVDCDYLVLEIDGILVPFFFDEYRFKSGGTALFVFDGVDSKEKAQELTGCGVFFPKALSDRDADELSWGDLRGFRLIDAEAGGKVLGTVTAVDESTINTLLNVRTPDGRDILVPAAEELILSVSAESKEIEAMLPEGLLDLDS